MINHEFEIIGSFEAITDISISVLRENYIL